MLLTITYCLRLLLFLSSFTSSHLNVINHLQSFPFSSPFIAYSIHFPFLFRTVLKSLKSAWNFFIAYSLLPPAWNLFEQSILLSSYFFVLTLQHTYINTHLLHKLIIYVKKDKVWYHFIS